VSGGIYKRRCFNFGKNEMGRYTFFGKIQRALCRENKLLSLILLNNLLSNVFLSFELNCTRCNKQVKFLWLYCIHLNTNFDDKLGSVNCKKF